MDMVTIIRDLGLPVALLLGMGWGLYQGICWFGTKVILPLQARHLTFLDKVEAAIDTLTTSQSRLGAEIERISNLLVNSNQRDKHG